MHIFDGDEVSGTVGADVWNFTDATTPKQYWIPGAPYKFVAVVDGNKTGVTVNTDTTTGLPTSINYTVDGATDLLCDVVTLEDVAAPYSVVAFTYTHLLSKVKFSVKNTTEAAATNYRIVLTTAKLTNVYKSGVYEVDVDPLTDSEGAWNIATENNTREYNLDLLTINSGNTQFHAQEILLLPGESIGLSIAADIEATSDGGNTWKPVSTVSKTVADVVTLAQAKAYNMVVELGIGEEIKFTATTMEEWGNGNTADSNDADDVNDYVPVN